MQVQKASKGGASKKYQDNMLEYLKSKPASWFTEKQADGQPRALCESFCINGKCQHEHCVFGAHGGHPTTVTEDMKK